MVTVEVRSDLLIPADPAALLITLGTLNSFERSVAVLMSAIEVPELSITTGPPDFRSAPDLI